MDELEAAILRALDDLIAELNPNATTLLEGTLPQVCGLIQEQLRVVKRSTMEPNHGSTC